MKIITLSGKSASGKDLLYRKLLEKHKELKTKKKVSTIYCNRCGKYKTVSKYWLTHE